MITYDIVKRVWPQADEALIQGIVASWPEAARIANLNTPLVAAHFFAQMSEESRGGSVLIENLNYTNPTRLVKVWPSRFNLASAALYVRRPQALANKVYGGRMGNDTVNDGWTYRGRGLKMITGKDMYRRYGLLGNPDRASDPRFALILAAQIWRDKGCGAAAARNDIVTVTQLINGGQTNIASRRLWLAKWKNALLPAPSSTLVLGDYHPRVEAVQAKLGLLNYPVGQADKDFGPATRDAVVMFQTRNDLPITGEVDPQTELAIHTSDEARVPGEARQNATTVPGSETIATAEKLKVAAGALGVTTAAGNTETGLLEKAKGLVEEGSSLKGVIEVGTDVLAWALSHWWIGAAILAYLAWRYGNQIIKFRLRDHQEGRNMSR